MLPRIRPIQKTKRPIKFLFASLAVVLVAALSGCVTLSEQECRQANWQQIGYQDGLRGRGPDYLGRHMEACAKTGIAVNRSQWEQGRRDGLTSYCTARKGYSEGLANRSYAGSCPVALEGYFIEGYVDGLSAAIRYKDERIYDARRRCNDLRRRLGHADNEKRRKKLNKKLNYCHYQVRRLEKELDNLRRLRRRYL